jgi:hypothetical protein
VPVAFVGFYLHCPAQDQRKKLPTGSTRTPAIMLRRTPNDVSRLAIGETIPNAPSSITRLPAVASGECP